MLTTFNMESPIVEGGEMGHLIRSYNWSDNLLGAISSWPQSLITSTNLILQSPVPLVMLWGQDGIMIYNDAYSVFAGQRHPFLLGSKVLEGWPEVADFNRNVLDKVMKGGGTLSYKNQQLTLYRNNAPEEVWMDLNYSAIHNEAGERSGVIAIVNETTQSVIAAMERDKMELALSESEEHLRALITATSDVIYTMNADWSEMGMLEGKIFVPDLGKPRNDWFVSNIPVSDQPIVREAIEKAIRDKSIFQEEHRVKRADGSIGWTSSRAIPIINKNGEIEKWFGAASDITERKIAEENLNEKNNELLRINSDLDNFIYTASHDLKAPVSNIEGLILSLASNFELEDKAVDEDTQLHLEMMQISISKFKNTINELTEISKVQKLHKEDIEEVNVSEIFDDVKFSILNKINEIDANITADLCSVPILRYSRKNLRSIIYNLLSNALKYTDTSRKAQIGIELKDSGDWYVMKISDNGLGIDFNDQKKIFSMYKRFHNHVEGSGIGLYIVKKIVDNAGGIIEVNSEIGKGSTFIIYFKK